MFPQKTNQEFYSQPVDSALPFTPQGIHVSRSDLSSAKTLTPPNGIATKLLIQCLTQNVRYTLDGTTPTSSIGFRLVAGDSPYIIPLAYASGTTVKVIEETATANLQYQFGV